LTLKLEAFYPAEGVGIVRSERELRVIQPPYHRRGAVILSEESLAEAILKGGFFQSQEQFNSWEAIIQFLNAMLIKTREAIGQDIPTNIDIEQTMKLAPTSVLKQFMDRIEGELIPERAFTRAEDLLVAMLNSDAVANNAELNRRAASLLRLSRDEKAAAEERVAAVTDQDLRFSSLKRHNQLDAAAKLAKLIKQRGCIYSPC
jgi:hypothetical protein